MSVRASEQNERSNSMVNELSVLPFRIDYLLFLSLSSPHISHSFLWISGIGYICSGDKHICFVFIFNIVAVAVSVVVIPTHLFICRLTAFGWLQFHSRVTRF